MEGTTAGTLFGQAALGHGDPTVLVGVGAYLVADLVFQTACEFRNYMRGERRFGACEQPATLVLEAGYGAIDRLLKPHERKE